MNKKYLKFIKKNENITLKKSIILFKKPHINF